MSDTKNGGLFLIGVIALGFFWAGTVYEAKDDKDQGHPPHIEEIVYVAQKQLLSNRRTKNHRVRFATYPRLLVSLENSN